MAMQITYRLIRLIRAMPRKEWAAKPHGIGPTTLKGAIKDGLIEQRAVILEQPEYRLTASGRRLKASWATIRSTPAPTNSDQLPQL
ncbi:hypothetical protein [Neorhizobium alkalisoli]|uniref:hypothetical protein n=1 Tax=Neorhizobium alkalisoli TaxID=528178 RepID=UPI0011A465CB|nr:hypothetical protein [Neorhizobium alkalisoli]